MNAFNYDDSLYVIVVKVLETCTGYYVKPTERIYKYGFEELFGLGPGCLGYNEKECVLLRK